MQKMRQLSWLVTWAPPRMEVSSYRMRTSSRVGDRLLQNERDSRPILSVELHDEADGVDALPFLADEEGHIGLGHIDPKEDTARVFDAAEAQLLRVERDALEQVSEKCLVWLHSLECSM